MDLLRGLLVACDELKSDRIALQRSRMTGSLRSVSTLAHFQRRVFEGAWSSPGKKPQEGKETFVLTSLS
eukprot:2025999-Amphidinium_carterae.1